MLTFLATSSLLLITVAIVHNLMSAALSGSIFANRMSRVVYKITAIIGTPIHELSHAIACVLFAHKITSIKLVDLSFSNPTLGHVGHSWNTRSIYQSIGCFFIAIAPLITASLLVNFCYMHEPHWQPHFNLQGMDVGQVLLTTLSQSGSMAFEWFVFSVQNPIGFGKFLLVSLICFHCIPSRTDFHNAAKGSVIVLVIVTILIVLSLFASNLGFDIFLSTDYFAKLLTAVALTGSVMFLAQAFWLGLFLFSKIGRLR
ncbi:hypothetical protein [Vibrio marisflavi]|uniref:Integral membrane protein n=1 Tax=Vibrio marisflavi CECT 7928 TaxID=634439 RepID=A0ABN8DWT9_9VIBR|nr:hypothetical protein [Vibrio marisflavi]CAH0535871.1 hypothetical protein VMF7928_00027 [Vibrio marisflavi CECT 7928]